MPIWRSQTSKYTSRTLGLARTIYGSHFTISLWLQSLVDCRMYVALKAKWFCYSFKKYGNVKQNIIRSCLCESNNVNSRYFFQYLFLRVIPHHCLDAVRSSKDKPATVKATISQFNRVAQCVQGTCLCPGLKTSLRAKVISKWIDVANVSVTSV